jgi:CDP-diacylglycerol pyrophosphatase
MGVSPAVATVIARTSAVAIMLCLGVSLALAHATSADPNALWEIVHNLCVPDQQLHGDPAPCQLVDLRHGERDGYAVVKDVFARTQFLLLPTARLTGIESPTLLASDAPNYFARAWRARSFVEGAVHRMLPRDDIALAVNSMSARTQNQLHIHIDCVRADVRATLQHHDATIRDRWAPLGVSLAKHQYMAMRVDGRQLDRINPFRALADGVPGARNDMGHHTLVVIGATFSDGQPGFIMLDDHVDPATGDTASGEELQDHGCAIATSTSMSP